MSSRSSCHLQPRNTRSAHIFVNHHEQLHPDVSRVVGRRVDPPRIPIFLLLVSIHSLSSFPPSSNACFSYVRIRRKQQTFFIFIHQQDHVIHHLKEEIVTALSGFDAATHGTAAADAATITSVDDLKLMDVRGVELHDNDNCPIASLTNDQELHVVFRISDDEYESVDIQYYADATES